MPIPGQGRWLIAIGTSLVLAAGAEPPSHPIDLNTATATELMQLPRVGPRTAARILAFRKEHGPFRRPVELLNIKGIGEKAYRRLAPHLVAGPVAAPGGRP